MIQRPEGTGKHTPVLYDGNPPHMKVSQFMLELFPCRADTFQKNTDEYCLDYMKRFSAMARQLDESGKLKDVNIALCNLGLESRNILVDPDDPQKCISGVLDWDSAMLDPEFMACKPPSWIWSWKDDEDEDEDEREANDTPVDEDSRILKRVFEESAGPQVRCTCI